MQKQEIIDHSFIKRIQRVYKEYTKNIQRIYKEYIKNIQRIYKEYIKNIQRIYKDFYAYKIFVMIYFRLIFFNFC